jgi:membrane protease YdiL (CAAX protease family)
VTPVGFWLRICVATALAAALLVVLSPPKPPLRLPFVLAVPVGVAAGAVLLVGAVRAPLAGARPAKAAVVAGRHAFFGLVAANEEVLWRRVALGELLPWGALLALGLTTVAFALAHRRRVGLHLATGGVFGGLYLATGSLAAPIGAHWAYNELVARGRPTAPT